MSSESMTRLMRERYCLYCRSLTHYLVLYMYTTVDAEGGVWTVLGHEQSQHLEM